MSVHMGCLKPLKEVNFNVDEMKPLKVLDFGLKSLELISGRKHQKSNLLTEYKQQRYLYNCKDSLPWGRTRASFSSCSRKCADSSVPRIGVDRAGCTMDQTHRRHTHRNQTGGCSSRLGTAVDMSYRMPRRMYLGRHVA